MKSVKELYEGLKKHRGAINEVATRSGKTREWVRLVLKEKYVDYDVLEAAAKYLKQKEVSNAGKRTLIESLTSEAYSLMQS